MRQGLEAAAELKRLKKGESARVTGAMLPLNARSGGGSSSDERGAFLGVLSGDAAVRADGVARGVSEFGSVCVVGCAPLVKGKWYYEAELLTDGVMQLGWADGAFKGDESTGDGVGDDTHSWAFDGCRRLAWSAGEDKPYGTGRSWQRGDVL